MRRFAATAVLLALVLASCGDDDGGAVAGGAATESTAEGGSGTTEADGEPAAGAEGFDVQLTPEAEAPGPGEDEGTGTATLTLVDGEACIEATVALASPPKAMHVHDGTATEAGPVVVDFGPPTADDGWSVCAEADQAVLDEIAADPAGFYLNVHNADFPDGAVRAQLR